MAKISMSATFLNFVQMRWRELVAVVQGLYRAGFRVIAHDVNTHVSWREKSCHTLLCPAGQHCTERILHLL